VGAITPGLSCLMKGFIAFFANEFSGFFPHRLGKRPVCLDNPEVAVMNRNRIWNGIKDNFPFFIHAFHIFRHLALIGLPAFPFTITFFVDILKCWGVGFVLPGEIPPFTAHETVTPSGGGHIFLFQVVASLRLLGTLQETDIIPTERFSILYPPEPL